MKEGLEKKRPAEGPPPVEPKRVKFQHPGTKEEHEGTEMERDQKMAQWWAEIAAASACDRESWAASAMWAANATAGSGPTIGDSDDACVG